MRNGRVHFIDPIGANDAYQRTRAELERRAEAGNWPAPSVASRMRQTFVAVDRDVEFVQLWHRAGQVETERRLARQRS